MITIILVMVALAACMLIASQMMAAQNTGITVSATAIYHGGGDPQMVYLTAYEGITPGDNVAPAANIVYQSDTGSGPVYFGTADLNYNAVLDGNDPLSHDFAADELVGVITGHCHVRKVADTNGATAGIVQRIGATDGAEAEDNASTMKYAIGRALTTAASASPFVMNQWC